MSATQLGLTQKQMQKNGESVRVSIALATLNMSTEQRQFFARWLIAAGRKLLVDSGGVDPVQLLEDELERVKAGQK